MQKAIKTLFLILIISLFLISCAPKDTIESLAKSVEIRRDTFGIPHIKAKSEEALFFGMGFAQAEDKLELLAKNFLISQGRGAEFFGRDYLESDRTIARFRINEVAEREFAQADPVLKNLFVAFAEGINYYIAKHEANLPDWISQIEPIDPFRHTIKIFFEFIYWEQSYEVRHQLENLGSNMWAIAPKRTENGHTLFLANPHLPWNDEFVWYEAHLTIPGERNVIGAALIGTPFLAIGHNDFMAWSLTVNNPDMVDIYELKLDKEKNRYTYDNTWYPLGKSQVAIKVKEDNGIEEEKEEFLYSRHGPIMKIKGDKGYAVKVAGVGDVDAMKAWLYLPKVQSFSEFKRILNDYTPNFFNIAYGDREGNIFYASLGAIPVRKGEHDWKGIVDGSTSDTEWSGYHSFTDLPRIENPASGYVQNSNGNPGFTALSDTFNIEIFPFMFRDSQSIGYRTQLGLIMLEEEEKFTLEKLLACKWNPRLLTAERYKDELIQAYRQYPVRSQDKGILQEAVRVLEEWDNTTSIDNKGAELFLTWLKEMYKAKDPWKEPWNAQEPIATPRGIANRKDAVQNLIAAAKKVNEQYGTLSPVWSDIRYIERGEKRFPLAGEGGHYGSFRVTGWSRLESSKYKAYGGDSWVMAVEFSEPIKSFSIAAYGASDDPKSLHFADQTELFAKDKMKPIWFSEKDIKANMEVKYTPAKSKR
jgi:acyl-homoserine-lactone acylase